MPDYCKEVESDTFTNAQFVYKPLKDSFELYGLGPNGIDDNGDPILDTVLSETDPVTFEEFRARELELIEGD